MFFNDLIVGSLHFLERSQVHLDQLFFGLVGDLRRASFEDNRQPDLFGCLDRSGPGIDQLFPDDGKPVGPEQPLGVIFRKRLLPFL